MINKSLYTIFKTMSPLSNAAGKYKIPILFVLFLRVFIMPPLNYGQDYFPLQVGNRWVYQHLDHYLWHECDIREIIDSVRIDNKLYFSFRVITAGHPEPEWFLYYYMRKDSANRIWVFDGEQPENIRREFNHPPDSCWIDSSRDFIYMTKLVSTEEIVNTPAGQFDSCYYFITTVEALHTDFGDFYAPNIGLVRNYTEGWEIELKGAVINHVLYGDTTTTSGIEISGSTVPVAGTLFQNYPNPFNPNTSIGYQLPAAGEVSLKIYNLEGQLVRTLVQSPQTAGFHQVQWDATDDAGNAVAAGIYLCQMQAGAFRQTQRLVLLK